MNRKDCFSLDIYATVSKFVFFLNSSIINCHSSQ